MDRIRRPLVATLFVALALSLATAAFAGIREPATPWYDAALSGAEEVPHVRTEASGTVTFNLDEAAQTLEFRMKVRRLDGMTAAHIHLGARGENGAAVALLAGPLSPPAGPSQSKIAYGVITPESLFGPLAGDWDGFVDALRHGELYVNVHTAEYPAGEIRGQISPRRALSPPMSPPVSPPMSPPHGR